MSTATFKIQPQRQPIGSFTGPNGQDVPVYITLPWFKSLSALDTSGTTPVTPTDGITFDALPIFQYGDIVFASGPTSIARLASVAAGNVFYDGGPGVAPFSAPLPAIPAGATPRQITRYVALRAF